MQERYESDIEAAREGRREAFAKAQEEGLSHSEIAAEVIRKLPVRSRRRTSQ